MTTQFYLYADGKYADVQLQVDSELFECNRSLLAANSEYFDTMFRSNFQESNTPSDQPACFTLNEIMDATAFEEMLRFIYTGEVFICDSNVFQLLFMNDLLRLRTEHVKEECIKHLLRRSREPEPISNAIDLFSFACMKAESRLVDLLSAHICEHLHEYSENVLLMEIDFEHLNTLLKFSKNYIVSLPGSQNVVLKIIHYWIDHDRKKRAKHRHELMKNIDAENISAEFALLLMNRTVKMLDEVVNHSRTKIDLIDVMLDNMLQL